LIDPTHLLAGLGMAGYGLSENVAPNFIIYRKTCSVENPAPKLDGFIIIYQDFSEPIS